MRPFLLEEPESVEQALQLLADLQKVLPTLVKKLARGERGAGSGKRSRSPVKFDPATNGTAPRSLLLHGTYDPMPIAAARETAGLLSTGVIELATGHAPHVEATEEFERVLGAFLPRESDGRTVGPSDR